MSQRHGHQLALSRQEGQASTSSNGLGAATWGQGQHDYDCVMISSGDVCAKKGHRARRSQTKRQPQLKGDHEEGALSLLVLDTQSLSGFWTFRSAEDGRMGACCKLYALLGPRQRRQLPEACD
jgi:hypothetical protein